MSQVTYKTQQGALVKPWRVLFLLFMLFVSALFLVHTRYQARVLFAKIEKLNVGARSLDADWALLDATRGRLTQQSRIDDLARNELMMVPINSANTLVYELVSEPLAIDGRGTSRLSGQSKGVVSKKSN